MGAKVIQMDLEIRVHDDPGDKQLTQDMKEQVLHKLKSDLGLKTCGIVINETDAISPFKWHDLDGRNVSYEGSVDLVVTKRRVVYPVSTLKAKVEGNLSGAKVFNLTWFSLHISKQDMKKIRRECSR